MIWDGQSARAENSFIHPVNIYWVPAISKLCPGGWRFKNLSEAGLVPALRELREGEIGREGCDV